MHLAQYAKEISQVNYYNNVRIWLKFNFLEVQLKKQRIFIFYLQRKVIKGAVTLKNSITRF